VSFGDYQYGSNDNASLDGYRLSLHFHTNDATMSCMVITPEDITACLENTGATIANNNDISLVKNSYMRIDKSIPVGKAFDTYAFFAKTEWNAFITEKDQHVVEFKWFFDKKKVNENYKNLSINKDIIEVWIIVKFAINYDETFNVVSIIVYLRNSKIKEKEVYNMNITSHPDLIEEFLQDIYQDKLYPWIWALMR